MSPTNTENLKEHLGEAGSHLKAAAGAAGAAVKGVAGATTEELRIAKAEMKAQLRTSRNTGVLPAATPRPGPVPPRSRWMR
jgi:hypothetical protein